MSENILRKLNMYPALKDFVTKKLQTISSSPTTNMSMGVFNTFNGTALSNKIIETLLEGVFVKNSEMIKNYIGDSGDSVQIISELKNAAYPPSEENEDIYVNVNKVTRDKQKFNDVLKNLTSSNSNSNSNSNSTSNSNSNVVGGRRKTKKSKKSKKAKKSKKTRKH